MSKLLLKKRPSVGDATTFARMNFNAKTKSFLLKAFKGIHVQDVIRARC